MEMGTGIGRAALKWPGPRCPEDPERDRSPGPPPPRPAGVTAPGRAGRGARGAAGTRGRAREAGHGCGFRPRRSGRPGGASVPLPPSLGGGTAAPVRGLPLVRAPVPSSLAPGWPRPCQAGSSPLPDAAPMPAGAPGWPCPLWSPPH